MNYLKSIFCFWWLAACAFSANAQDTQPHYRYFTISIHDLSRKEYDQMAATRATSELYILDGFCDTSGSIRVKIDASTTPKRIEDIKLELEDVFSNQFSASRIKSVQPLSYSDQLNFCK